MYKQKKKRGIGAKSIGTNLRATIAKVKEMALHYLFYICIYLLLT